MHQDKTDRNVRQDYVPKKYVEYDMHPAFVDCCRIRCSDLCILGWIVDREVGVP